ncbi:RNA polymerase sigma-G factor [Anoxybacter fermentans]|uniref:RNA polymerase sigma factor n=1 Tax=Anoxybacter fermentans TaxID=1323375 RepID=A0A3Q9HNZ2_9FIRM|nr:SigF/SigG family RNA polymerase sporulation sigma factor [Anoxybacter fermentans]AZR72294.1 RNA polymerase sigma-G factor [Anoxybacter fermentans]
MANYRQEFGHIPHHEILSDAETRKLIALAQEGDDQAKERLVQHNLRLVMKITHRFKNSGYEMEDLFQVGTIGLIKAIRDFDLSRNLKFSTYAVPRVIGEIRRFIRDDGLVKVSRTLKESASRIRKFKESFIKEEGREPTVQEISQKTGLTPEDIINAMEAVQEPTSLFSPIFEKEGEEILLIDQIYDDQMGFVEGEINKIALRQVLSRLDERSRRIVFLRYFQERTQTEIAEILGISQVHVSRLEKKVLEEIKHMLA